MNACGSRARNKKFSGELTHRDFLGALMNLGIERAMIGDIVVKDLDGYVMVLKKISRYVLGESGYGGPHSCGGCGLGGGRRAPGAGI